MVREKKDPVAKAIERTTKVFERVLSKRDAQIAALTEQVTNLTEQVETYQGMLFGRRSEKMPPIESEVRRLVDANELTVEGEPMPKDKAPRAKEMRRVARKKSEAARKRSRTLRKNLPVVHETIEVHKEDLPDGTAWSDFREVSCGDPIRRVEHVREHLVVVEYSLQTLASQDGDHIVKASPPSGVKAGCLYGPSVHAHVAVSKCDDSIPLHRLKKMLDRAGCSIARSTLCTVFHRTAAYLSALYQRFLEVARNDFYLHADETTLGVLAKGGCLKGWLWGIMSTQIIAFTFDESRKSEVANDLIGDSEGYLTIDGYSGYNEVAGVDCNRTRVGCWGHARRKFFSAIKNHRKVKTVMKMITQLYKVEHDAAMAGVLGTAVHLEMRQQQSAPLVTEIEAWVDSHDGRHGPKSAMGKAIKYAVNQRDNLRRFLEDSKLALDNNYAERSLRIIALGRKNFLFAGSFEHGQNLAVVQSIVSTCRLHGVNPYEYIRDVIIRAKGRTKDEVDELLPWNWLAAKNESTGPPGPAEANCRA